MTKWVTIAKHEYIYNIRRKEFLFVTFGVPLFIFAIVGLPVLLIGSSIIGATDVSIDTRRTAITMIRQMFPAIRLNSRCFIEAIKTHDLSFCLFVKECGAKIELNALTEVLIKRTDRSGALLVA